ncbi:MAG: hypothetical protein V1835_01905 [Candidatus Micrarchaeota archaeon]
MASAEEGILALKKYVRDVNDAITAGNIGDQSIHPLVHMHGGQRRLSLVVPPAHAETVTLRLKDIPGLEFEVRRYANPRAANSPKVLFQIANHPRTPGERLARAFIGFRSAYLNAPQIKPPARPVLKKRKKT